MSKVVIDTNVIVSSLYGGRPREVIHLWLQGDVQMCVSTDIVAEYTRVLERFGQFAQEVHQLRTALAQRRNLAFFGPTERVDVVLSDPDDNKFLECAVAAEADVIISGDSHLLSLGQFRGIPIITPVEFLARY